MNRNLIRSILGRSFIKIAILILLPSFDSFGKAASEEKIYLEINQSEIIIFCGGHVCKRIGTNWAFLMEDLIFSGCSISKNLSCNYMAK
jgi:hypothetical protein